MTHTRHFRVGSLSLILILFTAVIIHAPSRSWAVRLVPSPDTSDGNPDLEFYTIALDPNGTSIITNAQFNPSLATENDRVYSFPIPANPLANPNLGAPTQLSTQQFGFTYDVEGPVTISPNGSTILYVHDGTASSGVDTIHTMPIAGDGFSTPTGLFGSDPNNLVAPGTSNFAPVFSPNGSTIFFVNENAGTNTTDEVLYSIPAAGGVTTALTPLDEDLGEFAITPDSSTIIYSQAGGGDQLFSLPASGGTPTAIPMTPSSVPTFDIDAQISVTPDGQNVLFVGDYEIAGQNELYSLPLLGGTPTRLSDNLPSGADVASFLVSPDGNSVIYIAGQNEAATNELFLTSTDPNSAGAGNSVRVSEAPPDGSGAFDVRPAQGTLAWSPDSSLIYYVGDMTTSGVNDLYVVDTSEKLGFVPSPDDAIYFYVGPSGGDFLTEANWSDDPNGGGTSPADNSLQTGPILDIILNLVVDGTNVSSIDIDFGEAGRGTLTLVNGANLTITVNDIDFDSDSELTMSGGSTISTADDVFLGGTMQLTGGSITAGGDDIEIQGTAEGTIDGTTLVASDDLRFDGEPTGLTITNAILEAGDDFNIEDAGFNLVVTDTSISIDGGGSGVGDIDDNGSGVTAGSLTLLGTSTLDMDDLTEGADLVLGDSSTATVGNDPSDGLYVGQGDPNAGDGLLSTISLESFDASLTIPAQTVDPNDLDPRDFIIHSWSGLTFNEDPSLWNDPNWDGESAVTLSIVGSNGDYDANGIVDGRDFLLWQRIDGSALGLAAWEANYGNSLSTSTVSTVPEPSSGLLSILALFGFTRVRHRSARRRSTVTFL